MTGATGAIRSASKYMTVPAAAVSATSSTIPAGGDPSRCQPNAHDRPSRITACVVQAMAAIDPGLEW